MSLPECPTLSIGTPVAGKVRSEAVMKEELPSQTANSSNEPASLPAKLQSKRLSTTAGEPGRILDETKSPALHGEADEKWSKEQGEFAYFVHQYLRDFIKFADQKAAFIMAIASAILAFLTRQGAYKSLLTPIRERGLPEWAASSSFLFIALAGLLALLAVLPRLGSKAVGIIYWKGILQSGGPLNYRMKVQTVDDHGLIRSVLDHSYELAEIADRKYEILKWATWIGTIGCLTAAIVLLGL